MQDTCPSTHKNSHLYIRCLHDACKLLGGEHALAQYLGVSVVLVDGWLNGRGHPPPDIFLRCTDLLDARKSELEPD